ncbi:hypothetical protein F7725_002162 [Dissostichus mawsoni]|uniref:Uncharacterized protein n=1 Tax=Dissostichus mawsoni TaxID=36200 RepID=A0A7J5Y2N7_DISMA|nr:hypothetical protein F7725_002162 [Dissostichus mawsoni]
MIEHLAHVFPSEALVLHLLLIVHLALSHITIVKLIPAVLLAVAAVPLDYLSHTSYRVRLHVQLPGELKVVIELDGTLPLPVVVEAFQLDGQDRRQLLYQQALHMVGIGSFKQISFNVLLHGVQQVLVVPDVYIECSLHSPVGASLTDLLVSEGPSQHLAQHGGVAQGFQHLVIHISASAFNGQDAVADWRDHVQLLDDRVHITGGPGVLQTYKAFVGSGPHRRQVANTSYSQCHEELKASVDGGGAAAHWDGLLCGELPALHVLQRSAGRGGWLHCAACILRQGLGCFAGRSGGPEPGRLSHSLHMPEAYSSEEELGDLERIELFLVSMLNTRGSPPLFKKLYWKSLASSPRVALAGISKA